MNVELEGSIPAVTESDGEMQNQIIYSFDDGYLSFEAGSVDQKAYDHFAAGQASAENHSALADFAKVIYDTIDFRADADLRDMGSAELVVENNSYNVNPNAALLYASATGGEINVDEELLNEADDVFDDNSAIPDEEEWFKPSIKDLETSNFDINTKEYNTLVVYDRFDATDCSAPHCQVPHKVIVFENDGDESALQLNEDIGSVPENYFKKELGEKVKSGDYTENDMFSAAAAISFAEHPVDISQLKLDSASLPCKILGESGVDVDVYWEPEGSGKSIYADIEDSAVEITQPVFAALFPGMKQELYMNGSDLKNENLGVDGSEPAPDLGLR